MTRLIYNSKDNVEFNRAQLSGLPTPSALGRFHQPYSFDEYVGEIHHGLNLAGIEVNHEEYVTTHANNRLFGALELILPALEGEYIPAGGRDHKLVLGLRGSHDQSVTRGLALGTQVLVCSNLCFNGDLGSLNTKQTLNIGSRLPGLIRSAIDLIPEQAAQNVERFDRYRNFDLSARHGDAALVEIFRRRGLSAPQLGKAINEWAVPSHDEHAEQGFTVWRLLNACTEAVKPTGANSNPQIVQQRTAITSNFLDEIVRLN